MTYLSHTASFLLAGNRGQSLLYYVCIGENQETIEAQFFVSSSDSKFVKVLKLRGAMYFIIGASIMMQLYCDIKIRFYKEKLKHTENQQFRLLAERKKQW